MKSMRDDVFNYSMRVLEVGMLFKALLCLCKTPDRLPMLSLLKLFMPMLLAQSYASKYAQEIIRFLVHQYAASPREATETFYRLFVNTTGKIDSHIPADLQMEHVVKRQKRYVTTMFAGRSERNVDRHTSAMCGINSIADNYDNTTKVLVRATQHKKVESLSDEQIIVAELRILRPFLKTNGRLHTGIGRIYPTGIAGLDFVKFKNWLYNKQKLYSVEAGK
jgi:hypothetical protein